LAHAAFPDLVFIRVPNAWIGMAKQKWRTFAGPPLCFGMPNSTPLVLSDKIKLFVWSAVERHALGQIGQGAVQHVPLGLMKRV
jgi:hypothetical protein